MFMYQNQYLLYALRDISLFLGGMFDKTENLCIPNMSVLLQNL